MHYTHSLFWKNFKDTPKLLPISKSSINDDILKDIQNTILEPNDPYIVYTGNGTIPRLQTLKLNQSIKNNIKNKTVSIYLLEPLCLYNSNLQHDTNVFYNEFPSFVPVSNIRAYELDSIAQFATLNNIKNIKIYTCDYNSSALNTYYPGLTMHCYDIYIRTFVTYNKELIKTIEKRHIPKKFKFFCANWRFTPHRHLMMSYIHNKSGIYSWGHRCDPAYIHKYSWFDIKKIPYNIIKKLSHGAKTLTISSIDHKFISPNTISTPYDSSYPDDSNFTNDPGKLLFTSLSSICAIINESRYGVPFPNISEKTINIINAKLPFIMVSGPETLQYIKKLGFKTFNTWWDESYDNEHDHTRRFIKILGVIDYLDKMSIHELQDMYEDMKPTLSYNIEIYKELYNNRLVFK